MVVGREGRGRGGGGRGRRPRGGGVGGRVLSRERDNNGAAVLGESNGGTGNRGVCSQDNTLQKESSTVFNELVEFGVP